MKKALFTLILLCAVAVAVFYLGWAQSGLPAGAVGVLRSKTHGVDKETILPGKVRWVWYKLIPNNAVVNIFTLNDVQIPIELSGVLPSGAVYSSLVGLKTDFSFAFSGSLSYRIKSESLPALAEQENLLDQEDMDRYIVRLGREIDNHFRRLLWTYRENEKILKEAQETGTIRGLETEFKKAFPHAELRSCIIKTIRIPDLVLYDEIRQLYRDYMAAQRREVRDETAEIAAENIKNLRRFDELAVYGELLTKYPILMQYLALEKGGAIPGE